MCHWHTAIIALRRRIRAARHRADDWLPYLTTGRTLAQTCGLSLRQLDRALWVGASDPLPLQLAGGAVQGHQPGKA